ncbi:sigma-S stabilization anti-adapter protein IraP [Klebsiella sp. BIGb0407]|uniref:sigma-S stabilization anti-adapter protein IraP n=1 Tax=Klebsiella sp. BIGb0407 TaxID=2940603 RepID=UPI002166EE45|nr:hypothetical protein [Klebsiella sp. BIGb0407]
MAVSVQKNFISGTIILFLIIIGKSLSISSVLLMFRLFTDFSIDNILPNKFSLSQDKHRFLTIGIRSMKNFIAELLIKLAEKEEETKELAVQIKSLEIIVTGLLQNLDQDQKLRFISSVENSLKSLSNGTAIDGYDSYELNKNLARLLLIHND